MLPYVLLLSGALLADNMCPCTENDTGVDLTCKTETRIPEEPLSTKHESLCTDGEKVPAKRTFHNNLAACS